MKVFHVFNTMNSGGLQRVVLMLSDWLADRGVESVLVARSGPLVERVEDPTIFVEKSRFGFPGEVLQLLTLAIRHKPDVLHAHQRRDALSSLIVGRLLRIPVVEHAHNILPNQGPTKLSFRSRKIFAVSDEVGRMVVDVYGARPERVVVVGGTPANVTDVAPFERPSTKDRTLRILGIGRVAEQKDPVRFVRIVAEVANLRPVEARWLGSGPLMEEARREVSRLDAPVEFIGESDAVTEELDAADGLLITSKWEGLGLVVLEAFARRRPVVGVATGGLAGLLSNGRGTPVDPETQPGEFATLVLEGLEKGPGHKTTADTAFRYVTETASPDHVFGPVLVAYEQLSGNATSPRGV
ncbi:glycosyltransferase [Herbiconiux moechotypicola]|uniref:Glycosyltransferase subfamily 4-like N-terminal domain-containing protein n=1 Tax=Herbiconiux moechotypicola TaxID=637393 RepID=A0ABN3DR43_9MICO|nr:glycosyltransferase [Herbiconiux moechotypicola]MCS5731505.1 glycosyltransferase [Herbiconiux moechotypicola]